MTAAALLYLAAALLQTAALIFCLRMGRASSLRGPWLVMSGALLAMLLFRIVAVLTTGRPPVYAMSVGTFGIFGGVSSLSTSFMLLLALLAIQRISAAEQGATRARKSVEEALRQAETRYKAIFEATRDGLIINRPDGTIAEANPAAYRMHGYTYNEFLGLNSHSFVHPESLPLFEKFKEQTQRGVEFRCEAVDVRSDGTPFPVEVRGSSFVYNGQTHLLGVVRDISERKAAERALAESQQRLRMLFETTQDAILLADDDAQFVDANPAACTLTGYRREELLARHVWDLTAGVQEEAARGLWKEFGASGRQAGEYEVLRKDGSRVIAEYRAVANIVPGVHLSVLRDVTQRKRAEQEREQLLASEKAARAEAERASRMKEEFLATLSHELRTPLNAILGWSQILRAAPPSASDLAQGLETIERNAHAQTQIISDLLDMSRIISGRVRLDVRRLDPRQPVEAAIETVRHSADAKGIVLRAALPSPDGFVSGDPNRLQQVFWNLLSNAVKFTPRGGRVDVAMLCLASSVEISVCDTGEGIKPDFLPHVFDRFVQADPSTTRRHGGLGLGLAIVKQLVEVHGGTVRAESRGTGSGAVFTVQLPLNAPLAPEARQKPASSTAGSGPGAPAGSAGADLRGAHIIVVDDEPDARALAQRVLEGCGARVSVAASAADALALVRSEAPDALVSDIGMPGEDGFALMAKLKEMAGALGLNPLPALALSAYARPEDRRRILDAGYNAHLAKPVEPAELGVAVSRLIRPPMDRPAGSEMPPAAQEN